MTLLFTILLFPFFCQGDAINCDGLKEGLFKLESVDGSFHTIVRTKDKQVENVSKTGLIAEFDIKWTSNCTYLLLNQRVLMGQDNIAEDFKIDTFYNEIIAVNGNRHKVISSMKGYDQKATATLIKIDTNLLYRNINEIKKFKDYNGSTGGGILIGDNYSFAYRQHSKKETDFLIAFQEVLLINHKAKYLLLDHLTLRMNPGQKLATRNCRLNDKYDEEIVVIYSSEDDNEEAEIIRAWRFNRLVLKIEEIPARNVKYKVADKDLFLWGK
jgi:hypothetical protein